MVKSIESLLAKREEMEAVFQEAGVRCAFLFGSVLDRGRAVPARDLDIAVYDEFARQVQRYLESPNR